MNTSVQWTSKKLVAALIAAGVLGGMGATAVQQAPFAGHAQAQAAPPAVTATAPLPSATGVAAPDFSAITARDSAPRCAASLSPRRPVPITL